MTAILCLHPIFIENALMLSQKLNIPLHSGDLDPKENDLYLVFGGHERTLELLEVQIRKKVNYVIFNSEQPSSRFFKDKFYLRLLRENVVFDYANNNIKYLNEVLKIKVYSTFGFDFTALPQEDTHERDIDLLFIGSKTPERERVYEMLKTKYPDKNIVFDFEWKLVKPQEVKNMIGRAKVVLNIPIYEDGNLETHRINNALSCRCKVISHRKADKETIEFYDDFIFYYDDVDKIDLDMVDDSKESYEELSKRITPHTLHNAMVIEKLKNIKR